MAMPNLFDDKAAGFGCQLIRNSSLIIYPYTVLNHESRPGCGGQNMPKQLQMVDLFSSHFVTRSCHDHL